MEGMAYNMNALDKMMRIINMRITLMKAITQEKQRRAAQGLGPEEHARAVSAALASMRGDEARGAGAEGGGGGGGGVGGGGGGGVGGGMRDLYAIGGLA